MTILSVVKDVCLAVGVTVPQSVFTNITGNRTMQEMLSLANEMAQRIAYDFRDWTKFRKTQTFVGDGVAAGFDLPADYKRMLLTGNVWRSTSAQAPMTFIPDTDQWLNRRALAWVDQPWGEWTTRLIRSPAATSRRQSLSAADRWRLLCKPLIRS
jgi:hypothetical protein